MSDIFPESVLSNEELIAEFRAWVADPLQQSEPRIVEITQRYTPLVCYRGVQNTLQHYALHAYEVPKDPSKPVTFVLLHGADSMLPGVSVFGVSPEEIVVCACSKWRHATAQQLMHMDVHFKALQRARELAPKDEHVCPYNHAHCIVGRLCSACTDN